MAPKAAQEAAQKRAAKQKKRLMLLALPLVAALVYAYMTLSSLGSKPQPVQATPAAQTTPAGAIPSGPTATTITPGIATSPAGVLSSFVALGRKDPFHDDGPHGASQSSSHGKHHTSGGSKSKPKPGSKPGSPGSKPSVPLTGAVISVNGKKFALALGTEFGHAPGLSGVELFRLVKVSPRSAVIGVVGTKQEFTLHVHHPLTLEQNGGWTYTLVLEPLGTAAPMTVATTTTTTGN